jgi:hypothetical protein
MSLSEASIAAQMDQNENYAYLRRIRRMDYVPRHLARLCGDCGAVHGMEYCPACGSATWEMLEKILPKEL